MKRALFYSIRRRYSTFDVIRVTSENGATYGATYGRSSGNFRTHGLVHDLVGRFETEVAARDAARRASTAYDALHYECREAEAAADAARAKRDAAWRDAVLNGGGSNG